MRHDHDSSRKTVSIAQIIERSRPNYCSEYASMPMLRINACCGMLESTKELLEITLDGRIDLLFNEAGHSLASLLCVLSHQFVRPFQDSFHSHSACHAQH
jgi:hypothetical protein